MKHAIVDEFRTELEHEQGVGMWTVRCYCGDSFSATIAAGLTGRRTARAAWRRHSVEHEFGKGKKVAAE